MLRVKDVSQKSHGLEDSNPMISGLQIDRWLRSHHRSHLQKGQQLDD